MTRFTPTRARAERTKGCDSGECLGALEGRTLAMSLVSLTSVQVVQNPAPFSSPLLIEIAFESLADLQEDLDWKLVYVGSADSEEHDQLLDEISLGPVKQGVSKFLFEASPPDHTRIPKDDILGVTVLLLSASYRGKDFVRVGYYVNNEYTDEELKANPPAEPLVEKVERNILTDKPRVTRWEIEWDS